LRGQWEQTLAGLPAGQAEEEGDRPLKVFISYARKDEPFKDDLLTVLKPIERKGALEIWHDRKIEVGEEWRREIEAAMSQCGMALLFVSKNFLASPFIQDEELPNLLQRRMEEGLHVVPIIIGPCMWRSEPVLADLQVLPDNAQPVNSFPEGYARDRVWADIAAVIEERAKAKTGP
jgi:TIR domain